MIKFSLMLHILLVRQLKQNSPIRVLVFGETGTGKSNMICELIGISPQTEVPVDNAVLKITKYPENSIQNHSYQFFELDFFHNIPRKEINSRSLENLCELVTGANYGFNLLIFVVRDGSLSSNSINMYRFIVDVVTEACIPVIMVITHCENYEKLDEHGHLWRENYFANDYLCQEFLAVSFLNRGRKAEALSSLRDRSKTLVINSIISKKLQHPFPCFSMDEELNQRRIEVIWNTIQGKYYANTSGAKQQDIIDKLMKSLSVANTVE